MEKNNVVFSVHGNFLDPKEVEKKLKENGLIKEDDPIQLFSEKGYHDFYAGWLVRFFHYDNFGEFQEKDKMVLEHFDEKTIIEREVIFKKE